MLSTHSIPSIPSYPSCYPHPIPSYQAIPKTHLRPHFSLMNTSFPIPSYPTQPHYALRIMHYAVLRP